MLGARDDYVRATAALERPVTLRTRDALDAGRFAMAMAETARGWTNEEQTALAPVLSRLQRFISAMKWKSPSPILLVKASDTLMNGFPHTRGNAIVVQEGMLREMLGQPDLMAYLLAHEAFHVLSRANAALREELYSAIGFRPCAAVDMPAPLARLRLTNPDAPESRHAITVRWNSQSVEMLPFVHFPSETIDARAGFGGQVRTSWLPVERQNGRCKVREERPALGELEGLYEQVGRNTGYLIHPEEILADNFALLFLTPEKVASPEILERIRKILQ
ncbi:MAG TPA: hypothetical protein VGX52_07000 [Burkholderiales bacterium]|nr:hypothetical protein [Burkholderiales bacterium]